MYCPRCGTRLECDMDKCPSCGFIITAEMHNELKNKQQKDIPYYRAEMIKTKKIYLLGFIICLVSFILIIAFSISLVYVIPVDSTGAIIFSQITAGGYTLVTFTSIFALCFVLSFTIAIINLVIYFYYKKSISKLEDLK